MSKWLEKARTNAWLFYLRSMAGRAVIVRMMGGLGNQMFQYAAGRNLSARFGLPLFLDVSWLSSPYARSRKRPPFHLDQYNIKAHILSPDTVLDSDEITDTDELFINQLKDVKILSEQEINLADMAGIEEIVYLAGFWQSDAYFSESAKLLNKELKPRDLSSVGLLIKDILSTDSVAIHVRRGDYLVNQDRFPVLPPAYYDTAIRKLGENHKYYIFSDDTDWCRSHWRDRDYLVVEGNSPSEDLYLMSLCRNIVIANSSFSWWAAWLNNDGDKKVIAPMDWIGPGLEALRKGHDALPVFWERI